jgi:hypothetical protein
VELVYIICKSAPEKENGLRQFPSVRLITGASDLRAGRHPVPGVTESQILAVLTSSTGFACPFHAGLIPTIPGSAIQDFRIFHAILGARISTGCHDRQCNPGHMVISIASIAAITDVVQPATARKNSVRLSRKNG